MYANTNTVSKADGRAVPWNKGKLIGQKPPLKLKEIWAIRIRLQLTHRLRELALFNLAIDSKLRGCDLVGLHVHDGDDVRILSRSNFERRIEELKQDSEGGEQDTLMRGIYVLREFCLDKKSNA